MQFSENHSNKFEKIKKCRKHHSKEIGEHFVSKSKTGLKFKTHVKGKAHFIVIWETLCDSLAITYLSLLIKTNECVF